jgi:hypothetical protein
LKKKKRKKEKKKEKTSQTKCEHCCTKPTKQFDNGYDGPFKATVRSGVGFFRWAQSAHPRVLSLHQLSKYAHVSLH